ncbi:MAG: ribosome maturation factor RimP [Myxococcota bacterium]
MSDAIQAAETRDALRALIEPVVTQAGYELVELEMASDRGQAIVRLYVDTVPPSDEAHGVSIEHCTHVSRRVSEKLDETDPIAGEYRLEVSSPGIFRPLTKPEHFERALGARVRVKTHGKLDGRRVFVGQLHEASPDRLAVDVDGQHFEIPTAEVARANLEPLLD